VLIENLQGYLLIHTEKKFRGGQQRLQDGGNGFEGKKNGKEKERRKTLVVPWGIGPEAEEKGPSSKTWCRRGKRSVGIRRERRF